MPHITIDGQIVPFEDGQTVMQAATAAGVYIPHLCHHPDFTPHGSCRLCTVKLKNGWTITACTARAAEGQEISNDTEELNLVRKRLTQMLFVEGNHFCPSCEKTGNCQLQATAYHLNMLDNHYPHFYATRQIDASHPDILIDRNRCIFCNLCVRASRAEGKDVFAIAGRGINKHLVVNSESGNLGDSDLTVDDRAANICPTGAILVRGKAFQVPIGQRVYDYNDINKVSLGASDGE
jgi:[NiFe] hydrogenase diaphorase moiety small subunit